MVDVAHKLSSGYWHSRHQEESVSRSELSHLQLKDVGAYMTWDGPKRMAKPGIPSEP